jgi:hypothetical protein
MIYYYVSLGRLDVLLELSFDRLQFDDNSNFIDTVSVLDELDLLLDVKDNVEILNNINADEFLKLIKRRYDIKEMSIGYCYGFESNGSFKITKKPRETIKYLIDQIEEKIPAQDLLIQYIDALIEKAKYTEEVSIAYRYLKDNEIDSDAVLLLDKIIQRHYENEMYG